MTNVNASKITAFGEILWDIYPNYKKLGGAPFNFIYHVWKLSGEANFISSVGNDENGKELLNYLNSLDFETKYFTIDDEHPTGVVNVVIDDKKIPYYKPSLNCSFDYLQVNEEAKMVLQNQTDLLYFGTFTTRSEFSKNTLLSLLNDSSKKYFSDLNLRHNFFSKDFVEKSLRVCSVIKINEEELEILIKMFDLSSNTNKAVEQLIKDFDIEMVALTMGERGAKIFTPGYLNYCPAHNQEVIDTLGAGDAYSSILALGYLKKIDVAEINRIANDFSFDICRIDGAVPSNDAIYSKYIKYFR